MENFLYPIRKQALDHQAYLMVKAVLVMRSKENYDRYYPELPGEEALRIKAAAERFENDSLFLIFPSHHRQFRLLPQMVVSHRMVIAVYRTQKENGWSVKKFAGFLDENLVFYPCITQVGLPVFHDETDRLSDAIWEVMQCMEQHGLQHEEWYNRLEISQSMLARKKDGMYILHNAGFFDGASLWSLLSTAGVATQEVERMKEAMDHWLASFAMLVANGVWIKQNWK